MFRRCAAAGVVILALGAGCSKKSEAEAGEERPNEERPVDLTAKAVEELDKLCEAKNAAACFEAGNRYEQGKKLDQQAVVPFPALQRWDSACDLQHAQACVVLGDVATKATYLTAEERDSNSKSYYESACDLGSSDGCSRLGIHKTGGITWAVEKAVQPDVEITSVYCPPDPHGDDTRQCEVTAHFPTGFSGARSISVKFMNGGLTLGNDLLFVQRASAGEVVQKKIRTYAGTTDARIGYW